MKNNDVTKLYFGSDAAGYQLKNKLMEHFKKEGYDIIDVGCFSEESCHYPEYAALVAKSVRTCDGSLGILICGTGIGMSMAANKFRGIRAAVCSDTFSARLTRQHNNANILCMGARVIGEFLAYDIADSFVEGSFEGGRHALRVGMIDKIEEEESNK